MKRIGIILLLASACCIRTNAQVYISGGINSTSIPATDLPDFYTPVNLTWQAAVITEITIRKSFFVYTGLSYETKNIAHTVLVCCSGSLHENLHVQYLGLPAGVGIHIAAGKNWRVGLTTGAYASFATGGKTEGTTRLGPNSFLPTPVNYKRNIEFGANTSDDLKRWNWGLQAGASIAWKKISLRFNYRYDINPFTSISEYYQTPTPHYNTTDLGIAYQVLTLHK